MKRVFVSRLWARRYLLTEQSRLRSVNDIMPMIGARFYTQLDASQMRNDVIEEDLAKVRRKGRAWFIPIGGKVSTPLLSSDSSAAADHSCMCFWSSS